MFSFGGFSSIIPYIGYLSVMWVCILIGVSGQYNKISGILHFSTSSIITFQEINADYSKTTHVFRQEQKVEAFSKRFIPAFGFVQYRKFFPAKFVFFDFPDKTLEPAFYASAGLRAPPSFI
jgi:hypothetical protein